MRTKVQEDIITYLDAEYDIRAIEDMDIGGGNDCIEVTTFNGDAYVRFNVMPDGTTDMIIFKPTFRKKLSAWSMEEHWWNNSTTVEESGDESFDVVVEKELKEEKKVIDLRETYAELIEGYISYHEEELKEYAEDCKRENFEVYAEDSLKDVIQTVISNYYDNYDFDDVTFNDEDIEQMLIDEGILD